MFLMVELLFLLLLLVVLYLLYKNDIILTRKKMLQAGVEEYWNGKERRRHIRFKHVLNVDYAVEKKPHLKQSGKTIDISAGGMKLLMSEKLAKGTILDLKIALPDSKDFIEVEGVVEAEGEVAWSEDAKDTAADRRMFYTGIKFLAIKEPSGKRLSDYINSIASSATEA
jgi:c-di-GMP-binding flagellar brake protein YcgR